MQEEKRLKQVIETLRLLAADCDTQTKVLPNYVHVPDEIALTFEDTYLLTNSLLQDKLITEDVKSELDTLNELFDQMNCRKELWTLDQLKFGEEWQQIRSVASRALKCMNRDIEIPNLFWLNYISTSDEVK